MTDQQQEVGAILRAAANRVSLDQVQGVPDPRVGEARDGIRPGEWGSPPEMPPDCPVRVLGKGDGQLMYLVDVDGMLTSCEPSEFGQKYVEAIFGDRIRYVLWAWPRYTKDGSVTNFRAELVHQSFRGEVSRLMREGDVWDPTERVRGRGAWKDGDGGIIYHAGSYLWRKGEVIRSGIEMDGHFYPRRRALPLPWPKPVPDDDPFARDIARLLTTWSWGRPKVDGFLVLGWMAAALMSGALHWRPSMFLVGDKAVGKSTLQNLMKSILGEIVIKTDDTTEAGIYQRLGMDALPVQVDELEAGADNRRVMAVINLARIAASGGLRLRGGQDHKGIEFNARSCFFFSAINPPPVNAADWSRLAVISVRKLDPARIKDAPVLVEKDLAEAGRKMLRRMLDHWGKFEALFKSYAAALAEGGHDARGQDTYGVFLAAAHVLLGDEGVEALGLPIEGFGDWSQWLGVASLPEMQDQGENWRECLSRLMSFRVDSWRGGQHLVIGGLLDELRTTRDPTISLTKARELLALTGLGLVQTNRNWERKGLLLAIPNRGDGVGQIYANSKWTGGPGGAGTWYSALRQCEVEGLMITDPRRNNIRINGDTHRCTLVDLDRLDRWMAANAAVSNPVPGPDDSEKVDAPRLTEDAGW